jgi:hypothetical protein
VSNLPSYAAVCGRLGIPWIALHDRDLLHDGSQKPTTTTSRERLDALTGANDLVLEWDNTLEDVLARKDGRKATPRAHDQYGQRSWDELVSDPALLNYCVIIESIQQQIGKVHVAV